MKPPPGHFAGSTPEERERTAALAKENGRRERGPARPRVNASGIPRSLPINGEGLAKLSAMLSPALCERLKRSTLGGALVFAPSNF